MSLRPVSEPVKPLFASRRFFFPRLEHLGSDLGSLEPAGHVESPSFSPAAGVMIPYMIPDQVFHVGDLARTAEGADPSAVLARRLRALLDLQSLR